MMKKKTVENLVLAETLMDHAMKRNLTRVVRRGVKMKRKVKNLIQKKCLRS
jgi:hypothetical protein